MVSKSIRVMCGTRISIERENGLIVHNVTSGQRIVGAPLPKIMLEILDAGGLGPYFRQRGDFCI
ncbi:MAG TPA: hypothetical protein VKR43_21580 [Bryobacteraceae bacterium]|nr:hypothetical protein [Bryobacteraceae bacterium]